MNCSIPHVARVNLKYEMVLFYIETLQLSFQLLDVAHRTTSYYASALFSHSALSLALQVTLSLTKADKFASMLNCVLEVFGELLEVASLGDIGKCTEEILEYLKSLVSASPIATVSLVHQVCCVHCNLDYYTHVQCMVYSIDILLKT